MADRVPFFDVVDVLRRIWRWKMSSGQAPTRAPQRHVGTSGAPFLEVHKAASSAMELLPLRLGGFPSFPFSVLAVLVPEVGGGSELVVQSSPRASSYFLFF
jgi:hypothetical protein